MNAEPSSSRRLPSSSDPCGFPLTKVQCQRSRQHEFSWSTHWQLRDQHNPLNLKRFGPCLLARSRQWWDTGQVKEADQMPEWLKAQSPATLNIIAAYIWWLEQGSM